jgi:hypothetical protein
MTRVALTQNISIDFGDRKAEWERIRQTPEMVAYLNKLGEETVTKCNEDLHAAQTARKQPVADGYQHRITTGGTRARLDIEPTTARAIAHEAVNHTILKSLPIGGPSEAVADHEIPRELQRGGFKDLLDKREAERKAKADEKKAATARRREKAKVKKWLAAETAWKSSPDKWID